MGIGRDDIDDEPAFAGLSRNDRQRKLFPK
jgi:hypothetical protein